MFLLDQEQSVSESCNTQANADMTMTLAVKINNYFQKVFFNGVFYNIPFIPASAPFSAVLVPLGPCMPDGKCHSHISSPGVHRTIPEEGRVTSPIHVASTSR